LLSLSETDMSNSKIIFILNFQNMNNPKNFTFAIGTYGSEFSKNEIDYLKEEYDFTAK